MKKLTTCLLPNLNQPSMYHVMYIRMFRDGIHQQPLSPLYSFGTGFVLSLSFTSKFFFVQLLLFVKLRLARNLHYPTRPRPTALQPLTKPITRPWDLDFNLHRLKAVNSFKESPGCKSEGLRECVSQLTFLSLSSYQ